MRSQNAASLPIWDYQLLFVRILVSLTQSDNSLQIFVVHELPCQFGLQPGMVDCVELINGIQENFRDS